MNAPVRKLAVVAVLLVLALLVNANVVQVVEAGALKNNPHNVRTLEQQYNYPRGAIVVGGKPVATSVPTPKDPLKYLRVYPGGPEYAPVTGYHSLVYGNSGIESAENSVLTGVDSQLFVQRLTNLITGRSATGGTVVLTLNAAAQDAAWKGLHGQPGAVVALDPRTGAVLALVSSPSYDPGRLTTHDPQQISRYWTTLAHDPGHPLLDRALNATYPPGSTFKIITSAAALASGRYRPSTVIPAPNTYRLPQTNTYMHNFQNESCSPSQQMTMADALRVSCDTAYAQLGATLGAQALTSMAQAFGIGSPLRVPLYVSASSIGSGLNAPQTALAAIGQFDDTMTAMQMAMVTAAVANGGVEMQPYLVRQLQNPDLSVISSTQPRVYRTPISRQVAGELTSMMELVVASGTGTAAQIPGVAVAGKTGTAQHGANNNAAEDGWFVSFAPANDPKVAVAVVVPNAGVPGGTSAAPIAKAVMAAVLGR